MEIKNVLIRMPNWLGDMVMAAAFVQAVADLYPGAAIDVIVKKGIDFLADYFPQVGDKYVFSKAEYKGIRGAWRFGKTIKVTKQYDVFFCLPDSFSSAVMAKATGAKKIAGYKKELRNFLLTNSYTKKTQLHRVEEYLELLRLFSGRKLNTPPVQLAVPDSKRENTLVININSEAASRRLPFAKAVSLIDAVRKNTDQPIVLIGGPGEKDFVDSVYAALNSKEKINNMAGQTSLPQLLQLLASCMVMLSTDSGPAHLANAAGVHTVVLFGAGNESNTAPFNAGKTIIRLGKLPCEPCVSNTCKKFEKPHCLTLLDDMLVTQAVIDALKKNEAVS
jgi:heptosyltransferase II